MYWQGHARKCTNKFRVETCLYKAASSNSKGSALSIGVNIPQKDRVGDPNGGLPLNLVKQHIQLEDLLHNRQDTSSKK